MAGASSARRIELNRAWFTAVDLAFADGLFEMASEVILGAKVPDAEPLGLGLVQGGGVLAYIDRKKVKQASTGAPTVPKKPRGSPNLKIGQVAVYGGFGFPSRFLETGTIHMAAEPFLTPRLLQIIPDAHDYIRTAYKHHGLDKPGGKH